MSKFEMRNEVYKMSVREVDDAAETCASLGNMCSRLPAL